MKRAFDDFELTLPPRPEKYENVVEAAIKRTEEDAYVIQGLRKQNERLKAELLNAQLEASLEIAKAKFATAQAGEAHRRIRELETNLNDLRNWIAGNVVQRDSEYENLRANVSYLMGSANV